ncbi:MAG: metallophosphoesterase [Desulfovibrio sp.]|nr:metallophosphoesterase [Desulfovibrio sp.]
MSSSLPQATGFDIIGDIHGHLELLLRLLAKLGYRRLGDCWRHPEGRMAVFVGDLIDRGPQQVETVVTVRRMVEQGHALCCLGNHEFNAICHALGLRTLAADDPHHSFLQEAPKGSACYHDCLSWFLTLPVWLDLPGATVVHACYDQSSMQQLTGAGVTESHTLDKAFYHFAIQGKNAPKGTPEHKAYHALDTLLKGREIPLPPPHTFIDNDGRQRTRIRIRWWDNQAKTYASLALQPGVKLPDLPLDCTVETCQPLRPVIIGHYWLPPDALPKPLTPMVACVDYSAGHGGPLACYRYQPAEPKPLLAKNFVTTQSPGSPLPD